MARVNGEYANGARRLQAMSVASEWAKTFLTQSLIGIVLAVMWAMLGLQ